VGRGKYYSGSLDCTAAGWQRFSERPAGAEGGQRKGQGGTYRAIIKYRVVVVFCGEGEVIRQGTMGGEVIRLVPSDESLR